MSRNHSIAQGRVCHMPKLRQHPREGDFRGSLREDGGTPQERHPVSLVQSCLTVTADVGEYLLERHLGHTFAHQSLQCGASAPDREHSGTAITAKIPSITAP